MEAPYDTAEAKTSAESERERERHGSAERGTFALYSLKCRYAKVSLTPNQQAEDKEVSNYRLNVPNRRLKRAPFIKSMLESDQMLKYFILFITMLGTSMVIGDGILTPCISGTIA
ncbi:hypothetical protein SO802_027286 [Lithocarpus litseifolius]|uniref:K+ potassium transporter integral membrane domain-containing protein n=1 Tax=Lithocarpus litseifolius TaxID=425828 RepID=A0AAW2C281_9ROSI